VNRDIAQRDEECSLQASLLGRRLITQRKKQTARAVPAQKISNIEE